MQFRKIAGPMRIDTGSSGEEIQYRMKGSPGGRLCKTVQYMLKVYQTSDSAETEIGVNLEHGPDGEIYTLLAEVIGFTAPNATTQAVLLEGAIGAEDSNSEVVGEWLLPVIKIRKATGGTGAKWANVELFEMRKAF